MRFLKVMYDGNGYGRVLTTAKPTGRGIIRLELASAPELAQLFCDVAGEEQNHLHYEPRRLARWIKSYGVTQFGEAHFYRLVAERWMWQRPSVSEVYAARRKRRSVF